MFLDDESTIAIEELVIEVNKVAQVAVENVYNTRPLY